MCSIGKFEEALVEEPDIVPEEWTFIYDGKKEYLFRNKGAKIPRQKISVTVLDSPLRPG